jgi:hypothetical protein
MHANFITCCENSEARESNCVRHSAVPSIPAIGLVLVLSVDWFIGMARALGNLIGNCVATVVIAAWEGDLDHAKARRVLDGEELVDVTAGCPPSIRIRNKDGGHGARAPLPTLRNWGSSQ